MKTLIIALSCFIGFHAFAEFDTNLVREIKTWHKGDAPPTRLLKFPDGKIDMIGECGLRVQGSEVDDYISQVQNADLLAVLIFDSRSQADTIHAAVTQIVTLKGVGYVSRLLTEKRKADPSVLSRSELAVLAELLRSPYVTIQVARIAVEDMPQDKAETVLHQMSKELDAGVAWTNTYRKFSDLHPDLRDRATDPKSTRTLISYLYDSTVSPNGFDIATYRTAVDLPLVHLSDLFRAKRGTHVLRAAGGVYLYHITSYYDNAP